MLPADRLLRLLSPEKTRAERDSEQPHPLQPDLYTVRLSLRLQSPLQADICRSSCIVQRMQNRFRVPTVFSGRNAVGSKTSGFLKLLYRVFGKCAVNTVNGSAVYSLRFQLGLYLSDLFAARARFDNTSVLWLALCLYTAIEPMAKSSTAARHTANIFLNFAPGEFIFIIIYRPFNCLSARLRNYCFHV